MQHHGHLPGRISKQADLLWRAVPHVSKCVCVCVCACVRACVRVCVCACVCVCVLVLVSLCPLRVLVDCFTCTVQCISLVVHSVCSVCVFVHVCLCLVKVNMHVLPVISIILDANLNAVSYTLSLFCQPANMER